MKQPIVYTASSQASIDSFNRILELYLTSSNQVMPELEQLLSTDAEMPMGNLLRAYLLKLASDPRLNTAAAASLATAQTQKLNPREKMHAAAQTCWFAGDMLQTVRVLEQLLEDYPQDVLALRIAHHLHFYSGDVEAMRQSIERCAPYFGEQDPFYSHVLGMHSFGCEEAGDYKKAETLGRQAVELDPRDQWATHAVTHVMQMQSRFDEGIDWLEASVPKWQDSNNFIYHVHWHQALFEIGRGEPLAALAIYDEKLVAPLSDDFYLDLCNATSLLLRLEMLGVDVSHRWQALAQFDARSLDTELIFCTLHYLLVPARLNNQSQVSDALTELNKWRDDGSTQGKIVAEVGSSLAKAICDFNKGDHSQAVDAFTQALPNLHKIGGSHAQRALFTDMHQWSKSKTA